MPATKSASPAAEIAKKLSGSFNKTKSNETKVFSGNLPGGINGGLAEFGGGKLDYYKEGLNKSKPYMSLFGIVRAPKEHVGMQTRIRVDLFAKGQGDKSKSEEEMVDIALNELRKLGIDTSALNPEDWQDAIDSKAKEGVVFRFSTSQSAPTKQYPNPRIWENWNGTIESYESNGEEGTSTTVVEEPTASNDTSDSSEENDWAAIGEAAEGGDTEAQNKIKEEADNRGLGEEVDGADNWIEAAALLGGEAATEAATPEKGDTVNYKPPKAKKSIECEVTAVFEGKKTVNLKDENGNSYKGIAWTDLER